MPSYESWNEALHAFFIEGIQRGTSIFLSVDDLTISQVGARLGLSTPNLALADFSHAVSERVLNTQSEVRLARILGRTAVGYPMGVAFLCALTLAASKMQESEENSANAYFVHLQRFLGLDTEGGRPPGMEGGAEQPLWDDWAQWLVEQGLAPTATRGKGATEYIGLPISQTLLREADRDRLVRLFIDRSWHADFDADTLLSKVRQEVDTLNQHLRRLLSEEGQAERLPALAQAIYDTYDSWRAGGSTLSSDTNTKLSPNILAGLMRLEDPLVGRIDYLLYPQEPRRRHLEDVTVDFNGEPTRLLVDRPGWYLPIGPVTAGEVDQGRRYSILSPADLQWLVLPARNFWLLVTDRESPESELFASWRNSAPLGTKFVLLCQEQLLAQLERWRDERLLEWHGNPRPALGDQTGWIELIECQVVSQAWSGFFPEDGTRELYDALRPSSGLDISLAGGLRVPGISAWLDEYGPMVTVFGFYERATVRITKLGNQQFKLDGSHEANKPFRVNWPSPGTYHIEAEAPTGETARRSLKILGWDELDTSLQQGSITIPVQGGQWCGAYFIADVKSESET